MRHCEFSFVGLLDEHTTPKMPRSKANSRDIDQAMKEYKFFLDTGKY
jgi:hypothetical protein